MRTETFSLDGLFLIVPDVFHDDRGVFHESFSEARYREAGITAPFVQDNVSRSEKGVVRGLHYQAPPLAQGKLVQVLAGRVFDVAVDIRFGSPTFGAHVAVELSAENHNQLWLPPGFAHGFMALDEGTVFHYKCTGYYSKEHERGIRYDDPALGIAWPEGSALVSPKDLAQPLFSEIPQEFTFKTHI